MCIHVLQVQNIKKSHFRSSKIRRLHVKVKLKLFCCLFSPQSSLSVGSDIDVIETTNMTFQLRKSWDSTQEGAGLEV